MIIKRFFTVSAVASLLLLAPTLSAQVNLGGTPTYGTFSLTSGFAPDPTHYSVTAGGQVTASSLITASGSACNAGWIANVPDIRVHYTASSLPLRFYVDNPADTTLAINAPDGSWHCIDDSVGLNPVVDFPAPLNGQYDVFVGTFAQSSFPQVMVSVTELPNSYGPAGAAAVAPPVTPPPVQTQAVAINVMGTPTYGAYALNSGFTPDPMSYAVTAGGTAQSSSVSTATGGPCNAGWIAATPDVRLNYTAGTFPLRLYVSTPGTDTTLAINGPDGRWYCNDDTVGLHPVLDFPAPTSGQYDIFVGTFSQGQFPNVTLFVTELPASNGPTP